MNTAQRHWDRQLVSRTIKAYDVRSIVGEDLTDDFVTDCGAAFAELLREEGATTVIVAHDMRVSSPQLAEAFITGVTSRGLDVTMIGLASTDEMYCASGVWDSPGAMFTASHNPAAYNGIKMCRAGARPVGQDTGLRTISTWLVEGLPDYTGPAGTRRDADMLATYGEFVRNLVPLTGNRPLTVAVDAGNGMGGYTVPEVFAGLPLDVRPLYFELDGSFPNHEANPLDPKNLVDLQEFVRTTGADVGLAFDGDADRCFVVDERGEPVSASAICALIASQYLEHQPGASVIYNVITSHAVPEIVAEKGGKALRSRVGHSFIKALMAESGAVFGGEHSAHYYFSDFFNADSGIVAALHVLAALGGPANPDQLPLSELMREYSRYQASGEINTRVASATEQEKKTAAVLAHFGDRVAAVDRLDGVSVSLTGTDAWFNLRASNTEPLLRLNVEARTEAEVADLTAEVLSIVRA
ncbi:MAG: phosphomannomutase/phosphoglucomutase [Corynebacterium sp.]|nr:phosphomannomutase/phosphoglucomutase [Corynebacterium sp.]